MWRELDYAPDVNARSLRLRRTNEIGVIVSHFNDLWYAQVVHGLESARTRKKYSFLIRSLDETLPSCR